MCVAGKKTDVIAATCFGGTEARHIHTLAYADSQAEVKPIS